MNDGAEGWVTISGNQASVGLDVHGSVCEYSVGFFSNGGLASVPIHRLGWGGAMPP